MERCTRLERVRFDIRIMARVRRLAQEWQLTGWWLLAVGSVTAVLLRRHPIAVALVAIPVLIAASAAVWIGRTFPSRSQAQRRSTGLVIASSIAGAALMGIVLSVSGAI